MAQTARMAIIETRYSQTADRSTQSLFLLFLTQYRQQQSKSRFGEKTTHSEQHFDTFKSWFGDDFHFIYVVRNPIDTYASLRRYRGEDQQVNPRNWAIAWDKSVRLGLRYNITHRRQFRLLRYEDLISETETILEEICQCLGLPLENDRMLSMADFDLKDNSSFGQTAKKKNYNGAIRKSDDVDRRAMLSQEELNTILRICNPTAKLVGYDIDRVEDNKESQLTTALDQLSMYELLPIATRYVTKRVRSKVFPNS